MKSCEESNLEAHLTLCIVQSINKSVEYTSDERHILNIKLKHKEQKFISFMISAEVKNHVMNLKKINKKSS